MASLGAQIDAIYKLNQKIDVAQAAVKKLEDQRNKLEEALMKSYKSEDIEGASGKLAKANVVERTFVNVKDWKKLYDYIKKNNAWDLLQRRPSSSAYQARIEQKIKVPGCTAFKKTSISIRGR